MKTFGPKGWLGNRAACGAMMIVQFHVCISCRQQNSRGRCLQIIRVNGANEIKIVIQNQGHTHRLYVPESKVHGAHRRPTWVLSAPDGPHVGSMNLAIRDSYMIPEFNFYSFHIACLLIYLCVYYTFCLFSIAPHLSSTIRHKQAWSIVLQLATMVTHCGRDKMAAIFQTTFSNAFFWMKICKLWLRFHWSLFQMVQLTIFQHWFW